MRNIFYILLKLVNCASEVFTNAKSKGRGRCFVLSEKIDFLKYILEKVFLFFLTHSYFYLYFYLNSNNIDKCGLVPVMKDRSLKKVEVTIFKKKQLQVRSGGMREIVDFLLTFHHSLHNTVFTPGLNLFLLLELIHATLNHPNVLFSLFSVLSVGF